ncbi:DUF11 domain-containing protein, partial [bacterium]|nr:DUF11 domain-containing protein [bacterium]
MNRLAIIICGLLVFGVFAAPSAAAQSAELVLQKSDSPDPVGAGATLTYTITVDNFGPNNAKDSVLTDTLPAGVTFVSAPGCTFASP